jgi:hypothetical protein
MSETRTCIEIAESWISYQCAEDGKSRDKLLWSLNELWRLIEDDPEKAWAVIHQIRRLNGTEYILANLAAGPLEDLLGDHGDKFIERVELLSRQDEQFRKMLGAVWQGNMPEAIWVRVRAVAGPPF